VPVNSQAASLPTTGQANLPSLVRPALTSRVPQPGCCGCRAGKALLPVPVWIAVSLESKNGLQLKTNKQNTTEKQLPEVAVKRSICQRRQQRINRVQLQK